MRNNRRKLPGVSRAAASCPWNRRRLSKSNCQTVVSSLLYRVCSVPGPVQLSITAERVIQYTRFCQGTSVSLYIISYRKPCVHASTTTSKTIFFSLDVISAWCDSVSFGAFGKPYFRIVTICAHKIIRQARRDSTDGRSRKYLGETFAVEVT